MKYLIWLLIGLAVVVWFKRLKAGLLDSQGDTRRSTGGSPPAEAMRQCARCGMHIPASEAVTDAAGSIFCCEEHRAQHAAR